MRGSGPSSMAPVSPTSLSPIQLDSRRGIEEWLRRRSIHFLDSLLGTQLPSCPVEDLLANCYLL